MRAAVECRVGVEKFLDAHDVVAGQMRSKVRALQIHRVVLLHPGLQFRGEFLGIDEAIHIRRRIALFGLQANVVKALAQQVER